MTVAKTIVDAAQERHLTIAEALAKQPKRMVRIPSREGIKQPFVMVWVNGHSYQITRGLDVEVPQTVYEILVESGEI